MDTQALFKAKQELNAFLDANPHLKPLQEDIDALMKALPVGAERFEVLAFLMETQLNKLRTQWQKIALVSENCSSKLQEYQSKKH